MKTKIEELCEQFEREDVDLSGIHPSNIASVVKLYLRQLPEPILTHQLYPDFIKVAKVQYCLQFCKMLQNDHL